MFGTGQISDIVEKFLIFSLPLSSWIQAYLVDIYGQEYTVKTLNFWALVLSFLLASYLCLI